MVCQCVLHCGAATYAELVVRCGRHWAAVAGRMSSVEHCREGSEVELVVERRPPSMALSMVAGIAESLDLSSLRWRGESNGEVQVVEG